MISVLDKIVAAKWREIVAAKKKVPEQELRDLAAAASPARDFFSPLAAPGPIRLIAEVKKASPSKGVIRDEFNPESIARIYQRHGATCVSVLTDREFFQGSLDDLRAARRAIGLPLLRKDFVLDPYQVYEARAAGADAVLLIAECLDDRSLASLHALARSLGMAALVELYEPANLQRVFDAGATLIGVNNRDLKTFKVDLENTLRIRDRVPDQCVLVSESGIATRADVKRLEAAGVDAMLVGERLMSSADIGAEVDALLGRE